MRCPIGVPVTSTRTERPQSTSTPRAYDGSAICSLMRSRSRSGKVRLGELHVAPPAFGRVGLHEQLEVEIGQPRARRLLLEADARAVELAAHRWRRHQPAPARSRRLSPVSTHQRSLTAGWRHLAWVRRSCRLARRDARAHVRQTPLPLRLTLRSMRARTYRPCAPHRPRRCSDPSRGRPMFTHCFSELYLRPFFQFSGCTRWILPFSYVRPAVRPQSRYSNHSTCGRLRR